MAAGAAVVLTAGTGAAAYAVVGHGTVTPTVTGNDLPIDDNHSPTPGCRAAVVARLDLGAAVVSGLRRRRRAVVRRRMLGSWIVRVKIWDASGRVVYSDDRALMGRRFDLQGEALMRVLLVDDHAVVRHGLTNLLTAAGVDVVGSLEDGSLAEKAVVELEPDLVLMDLAMPVTDGIEATRAVVAARPGTKVIILTSFAEHARLHAALEAGAVGYLLKDAEPDDIIRAFARRRRTGRRRTPPSTRSPRGSAKCSRSSPPDCRTSRSPGGSRSARRP